MKKLILAAVAVLALAACDKGPTQTTSTTVSHTSDATGQKRTDALKITGYVMRSALGNNPNTVAYLTVKNDGDSDDKLVSAACDCAATTSLHTTSTKAGVMDMEEATDGFVIKPGETLTFAPGGNHVMLAGLKVRPKAGDTEVVSLTFAKAGVIKLDVPVSDTPQGG